MPKFEVINGRGAVIPAGVVLLGLDEKLAARFAGRVEEVEKPKGGLMVTAADGVTLKCGATFRTATASVGLLSRRDVVQTDARPRPAASDDETGDGDGEGSGDGETGDGGAPGDGGGDPPAGALV